MKIIGISDTHERHQDINVPDGDVLVHCGDMTMIGQWEKWRDFALWFGKLPHKHKICIGGNHDWILSGSGRDDAIKLLEDAGAVYLENSGAEICGLKWWGSGASPFYHNWQWNYQRGKEIAAIWAKIPDDVECLITHSPPANILDRVERKYQYANGKYAGKTVEHAGCEDLLTRIDQLKNLKISIFGHLHLQGGSQIKTGNGVIFANAAICDEQYRPTNKPIIIEINNEKENTQEAK